MSTAGGAAHANGGFNRVLARQCRPIANRGTHGPNAIHGTTSAVAIEDARLH